MAKGAGGVRAAATREEVYGPYSGEVSFGKPATYSGQKRVDVRINREDWNMGTTVLELRQGQGGWMLYLPSRSVFTVGGGLGQRREGRYLSNPRRLQDAKVLAAQLVKAAGSQGRLDELYTAEGIPAWFRQGG